jgi:hypothetical protein
VTFTLLAVCNDGTRLGTCGHEHRSRDTAVACRWLPDPWSDRCDILVREVRPPKPPPSSRFEDVACLRETMAASVDRYPVSRAVVFSRTRTEFGPCEDRRLERALRWLVEAGRVERTSDGYVRARRRSA